MVTLHARAVDGEPPDRIIGAIKQRLAERFGIAHATVELEFGRCADEAEPQGVRAPGE